MSFAPELLRRAVALAQQRDWDHLTLLGRAEMYGFWETIASGGLIFGTLFRVVGRPIFGHYARQVLANLETLERNPISC